MLRDNLSQVVFLVSSACRLSSTNPGNYGHPNSSDCRWGDLVGRLFVQLTCNWFLSHT